MKKVIGYLLITPFIVTFLILFSVPLYYGIERNDWTMAMGMYGTFFIVGLFIAGLQILENME